MRHRMTTAVVLMALTALACGAVVPPSDSVNVVPRESPGATASPPRATDSPSPTAPPEIHVGGLVRIVSSEPLTVRTRPGDGLGEPTRATASPGGTAFVADGPRVRDGRTWWLIREQFTAYGWAPARSADGRDVLEPFVPACPRVEAVTDEDLTRLGGAGSLVCFGNAELRFEATVTCLSAAVDGGPGGCPGGLQGTSATPTPDPSPGSVFMVRRSRAS